MQFPNPFKLLIISLFLLLALLRPKTIAGKIDQTNTELTQRYAYGVDIDSYGVDWISEKEYELIESIKTMQQRLKIDKLYLANSIGCRYHSRHPRPGWWSCYLKE